MVLVVCVTAPVSDNLESTDHLSDGEETNDLCGDNTGANKLLVVHVADAVDELTWVHRVGGGRSL